MSQRYVLHIGLPKTGTTALQRNYFPALVGNGLSVNPPLLVTALTEAIKLLDFDELTKADTELLSAFVEAESRTAETHTTLLSLELLSQRLHAVDLPARAAFLGALFPDADVVLVLRHQADLLRSLYLQHLSQRYLLQPEDVFVPFPKRLFTDSERWKSSLRIDVRDWDYVSGVRAFRRHFGDRLHVLFYEDLVDDVLGLGKVIASLCGDDADATPDTPLPRTNVSMNARAVSALLTVARTRLALRSYSGFDSKLVQDLRAQADVARHIFDGRTEAVFRERLVSTPRARPTGGTTRTDRLILRSIDRASTRQHRRQQRTYPLPPAIEAHVLTSSSALNQGLPQVVEGVPQHYLRGSETEPSVGGSAVS